ncbi:MAG: hypothetical protein V8Q75_00120 [Bacilli bacterium]
MSIRENINRLKEAKNWALNNQVSGLVDNQRFTQLFSDVLDLLKISKSKQETPIQYVKNKANSFVNFE